MGNTKKELTNGVDLGELGMIRNILMGQQINEWETQYAKLESEVKLRTSELSAQIKQIEKASSKETLSLHKELLDKIEKMEKQFTKRFEQLEDRLEDTSLRDQRKIGKLLADMGKKLLEE